MSVFDGNKRWTWRVVVCAVPVLSALAQGTDPVVELEDLIVTATRTRLNPAQVASAVTVISRREVERSGARDLAALLETLPALDVSRAGGPGGTATLRIRGTSDAHALLLIDGVEQNDPMSPGRAADLGLLSIDQIERVEVVRGPQSALYGADAIGGVVQVITRGATPGARVSLLAGSRDLMGGRLGLGAQIRSLGIDLSLCREQQGGFSAAAESDGNREADGLKTSQGRLRLDWQAAQDVFLVVGLEAGAALMDLDNFGGPGGDDPNHQGETRRRSANLRGSWEHRGGVSEWQLWQQRTRRDYRNPVDAAHPEESLDAGFQGRLTHAGLQQSLRIGRHHEVLAAVEWEAESGESSSHSQSSYGPWEELFPRREIQSAALVLQDRWLHGPWLLTAGLRRDRHSTFGGQSTGRLTAGWSAFPGGMLRGSWGSGFKAPSLYQLHSAYGNGQLSPERSRGWDLGFEFDLKQVHATLGYFRNDVRKQIDFDNATWLYTNIGRTTSAGVEIDLSGQARSWLGWSARLQRQKVVDARTGEELLRRPRTLARVQLDATRGPGSLGLAWRYEGPRRDKDFAVLPAALVELPGFALVDLRAGWRWSTSLSSWLALDNALDRRHQEILGYGTPGRGWRLGFDWSI